jgi:hypothetical protein
MAAFRARLRKLDHQPQSSTVPLSTHSLHLLNNKLGVILARCDLIDLQPDPEGRTKVHVNTIRDAAKFIAAELAKVIRG